ncbi:MAG: FAD-dependent oxidoreductase [Verrucomicrobia bacterium]|nr:FAD-dependent oxidoreductase [Verrucomicrobiota bacterium]
MSRKLQCTVTNVIDHGGRVYTVDLQPASPVPPFRPGQFLHLTVDPFDPASFWPESRVFSIASSPRVRDRIRICYAVKGRYTIKMEQVLRPGAEVWVKLPYGDFVIDESRDAVLLAGGTGVGAFTAFLEALTPDSANRVTLAYGARTPALFLYLDMLLGQVARVPRLDAIFFAETEAGAFPGAGAPRVRGCHSGRINLDALWAGERDFSGSLIYLSGPPVMLKALGIALRSRGIPPEHIRTDAWE